MEQHRSNLLQLSAHELYNMTVDWLIILANTLQTKNSAVEQFQEMEKQVSRNPRIKEFSHVFIRFLSIKIKHKEVLHPEQVS